MWLKRRRRAVSQCHPCCALQEKNAQLHRLRMILRVALQRLGGRLELTADDIEAATYLLTSYTERNTLDTVVHVYEIVDGVDDGAEMGGKTMQETTATGPCKATTEPAAVATGTTCMAATGRCGEEGQE